MSLLSRRVATGGAALLMIQGCRTAPQASATGRPRRAAPPPGLLEAAAKLVELRWETPESPASSRFIDPEQGTAVALSDTVVLDMAGIDSAWVAPGFPAGAGHWDVGVRLSRSGAAAFGATTATHVGRRLAVIVDGRVTMMPIVQTALGARAEIASGVSRSAADSLADRVNATVVALRPYLPVRLH